MNNVRLAPDDVPASPGENHSLKRWMPPLRRHPCPPEEADRRKTFHRRRKVALIVVASVLLLTLASGAVLAVIKYYSVYQLVKESTGQTLPTVTINAPTVQATPLPNDLAGVDHFNLLLLGSDNDSKFGSGAVLTQTDIVVRVDLAHKKITMVSIPRDMWLTSDEGQCCYKLDEISGAETDGASTQLDMKLHGFAHTVATIENDFHIPIDAYAWVGLDGFVKVIDSLGGVDVDVLHPVVDDAYPDDVNTQDAYGYKRLSIPAGPQHLDGEEALEYVRSRHSDLLGDFGRSARQQSVLLALKKKLNNPAIFGKLDELATDLQGSVLTSLTLGQVLSLANFAKGLQSSDFQQYVLGVPTYAYYDQVGDAAVVQPIWPAIDQVMQQIFT